MTKEEKKILCELLVKLGVFRWLKKYSWDYKELKQILNDFEWRTKK